MKPVELMTESESRAHEARDRAGAGTLATSAGNLPLRAIDVGARIVGLVARTTLRQTFFNPHDTALEATYVFPLPDRAAVTDYTFRAGRRVIQGVLKERGEAREGYDRAIERGHRASIVEEERPDVFTVRVGHLQPGDYATVQLELSGLLEHANGEVTYRFPLVVAPRYIPGAMLGGELAGDGIMPDTGAVPDASRISPPVLLPGFPNPVQLGITVSIDANELHTSQIRSSLHAVIVESNGPGGDTRVELDHRERVDRDFILRIALASPELQSSLLAVRDPKGDGGTFMLTVVPPAGSERAVRPRDVAFILDRSGSMNGWKIVAARRAMTRIIDTLRPQDRFALQLFSTDTIAPDALPADRLHAASDRNRFVATEYLANAVAEGGTEMASPLMRALDVLAGGYQDRDRVLVLITDGQIGNEDQILRSIAPRAKNVRIFTVGIDQAVNAGFLHRLAELGGGRCELVESEERLDAVLEHIHRSIDTPILTELTVELSGAELDRGSLTPSRPVDLHPGCPAMIFGRFRSAGGRISATVRSGRTHFRIQAREVNESAIASIWARAQIRQLEDRRTVSQGPKVRELEREIVETSLEFKVLSRFTAFVAIDDSIAFTNQPMHRVMQPVEQPAGWLAGKTDLEQRRQRRSERATHTRAGTLRGKFNYLTAAQARGERLTPRDDVFTLGVIFYELVTGERLFKAQNELMVLQKIVDWDESKLATEKLGVFASLIAKCLARDAAQRPASAIEVVHLLEALGFDLDAAKAELTRAMHAWFGAPPQPGAGTTRLGRHTLRTKLETGDSATSWITADGLLVIVPHAHLADDPLWLEGFLDETELVHPNILAVRGKSSSPPFLVTEYVPGRSLAEVMHKKPAAPAIAALIMIGMARGIAHACSQRTPVQYVNAKLDPDAVWIGFDGSVMMRRIGPA